MQTIDVVINRSSEYTLLHQKTNILEKQNVILD